jgi:hypothetical protein
MAGRLTASRPCLGRRLYYGWLKHPWFEYAGTYRWQPRWADLASDQLPLAFS